ncbi:hypothetical protein B0T20DRAFT_96574 [Sordaria brevicollis]|uniref:Secreted protein n=1 Tax=Sordaria brevicollis TaxID=83679 RepID=A0AAE0U2S9_SORBR|nr:hypothetical protein B0T20DRAFT_96574 [Sordaria brevicollis]
MVVRPVRLLFTAVICNLIANTDFCALRCILATKHSKKPHEKTKPTFKLRCRNTMEAPKSAAGKSNNFDPGEKRGQGGSGLSHGGLYLTSKKLQSG